MCPSPLFGAATETFTHRHTRTHTPCDPRRQSFGSSDLTQAKSCLVFPVLLQHLTLLFLLYSKSPSNLPPPQPSFWFSSFPTCAINRNLSSQVHSKSHSVPCSLLPQTPRAAGCSMNHPILPFMLHESPTFP